MVTTDYIDKIRQQVATKQASKGKITSDYIENIRKQVTQQSTQQAANTVVNNVTKNAANAVNTAYKAAVSEAAQRHGQLAKENHANKQQKISDQQVVNRLKSGATITDTEDIKAIARANGISDDEIDYVMGKMKAQQEPMLMKKEDIYKIEDAESTKKRNPVLQYDKNYGTQEAKKEIQGLDFKNSTNGEKYLEYQEKLAEAKRNNDTRNIAKYSTLVQDFKEKYKENYTKDEEQERKDLQALYNNLRTKGATAIYDYMQRDKDRLINTRDSLNQLYNDRNEILTRYAAATTPEEKQRIADEYYRIDGLIQEKRKVFGDLLAYDDTLNNNIIGDSASSFATQAVGGTANAINAGYSYGNKLIGNDLTTINPDQLLAYNSGDGFNANDVAHVLNQLNPVSAAAFRVTGQGEGPLSAAGHLARIAALYPDNARLQTLVQQIASHAYTGTREQLVAELDEIQKELYQGFKDRYTQDDLNRVEEQLRHNEAAYENAAFIPNAFGTIGNMVPSMALGYATGGIAELAGGGAMGVTGTLANKAQQAGSFGALGLGAAGQSMDEALANGAKYNQAQAYGALSGATEVGTEMLFGSGVNRALGINASFEPSDLANKVIEGLGIKSRLGQAVTTTLFETGGEMAEEMISEAVNPLWKAMTYNPNVFYTDFNGDLSEYFKQVINAGIEAIPSTLIMQGGGYASDFVRNKTEQIKNGIDLSIDQSNLPQDIKQELKQQVNEAVNGTTQAENNQEPNTKANLLKRAYKWAFDKLGNLKSFKEQINDYLNNKLPTGTQLVVSEDNAGLDYANVPNNAIIADQKDVEKVINGKHSQTVSREIVDNIQQELRDSVIAMDSLTQPNTRVVVLDKKDNAGNPIIALVQIDKKNGRLKINKLASVYEKNGFQDFLNRTFENNKQFYTNEKTDSWLSRDGLYLPDRFTNESVFVNGSIPQNNTDVNLLNSEEELNTQDLINDIKSVGGNVDENGYVTVYHRTTPEAAKAIQEQGKMSAKEDGLFFSTNKNGVNNSNYGDAVVELKIPAKLLELDDIFDDEASLRLPTKSRNVDIKDYLVNPQQTNTTIDENQANEIEQYIKELEADEPIAKMSVGLENVANLKQEDVKQKTMEYQQKKDKNTANQRKFFENVETSPVIAEQTKNRVNATTYEQKSNLNTLEDVRKKLDERGNDLVEEWKHKSKNFTDKDVALGAILVERYQQNGDWDSAARTVEKLADMGTEAGRAVQMYSIFQRLSPETMAIYQQKALNNAFEEMKKNKTGKWVEANKDKFKLTADETQYIYDQVEKASQAIDDETKQRELSKIETMINNKLPPEKGQTLKALRRIAMLFNPKTQVRNIVGNTLIMPINDVADLVGTAIDKAIAKKTGVRTTSVPNVVNKLTGFGKGVKNAVTDYKTKTRTAATGSKYEFEFGAKPFNENTKYKALNTVNRGLNFTNDLLSAIMSGGDRPFYEAAYKNSLQGQMKANNVTEPTDAMKQIALEEGLSRTWNDDNEYTNTVLKIRKAMNNINIKGFGLGDLIIPFAKTPANLTKAMVEYSPAGFIESIFDFNNMRKAISRGEMTPMQQKKFVTSMSKAIAGTVLYMIAGTLAKSGRITGSADDDKDVKNFEQNVMGIQPYSVKLGDKTYTYSWANPINFPLAVMADNYKMTKENASTWDKLNNAFKVAGEALVDNSFLSGIKELFSKDSIAEGIVDAIESFPESLIPTLSSQIASLGDKTQRQTFEYDNDLGTVTNKIKNKLPGARNTLAPQVNTFGEEIENQNTAFNAFLNPANVREARVTDSQKALYDVYQETKDKTIFPMQAPYYVSKDGEKQNLSSQDRVTYQKASGQYVSEVYDGLFNQDAFNDNFHVGNEGKVEILKQIASDGNTKGKESVGVTTQTTEKLNEKLDMLEDAGIPLADYYLTWYAQKNVSKKNAKRTAISQTIDTINEGDHKLSSEQKNILYEIFNVK